VRVLGAWRGGGSPAGRLLAAAHALRSSAVLGTRNDLAQSSKAAHSSHSPHTYRDVEHADHPRIARMGTVCSPQEEMTKTSFYGRAAKHVVLLGDRANGWRRPQIGALGATMAHWSLADREPTVVSIPTPGPYSSAGMPAARSARRAATSAWSASARGW